MTSLNLRTGLRTFAICQRIEDLHGLIVIKIFVIIVVDLHHRRGGAIAHALHLGQREHAVGGRLALHHALVLASGHDVVRTAQHAGRGAADLHVVAADRLQIVHGVKGRDLIGADVRHIELRRDIFDHRNRQPALRLRLRTDLALRKI